MPGNGRFPVHARTPLVPDKYETRPRHAIATYPPRTGLSSQDQPCLSVRGAARWAEMSHPRSVEGAWLYRLIWGRGGTRPYRLARRSLAFILSPLRSCWLDDAFSSRVPRPGHPRTSSRMAEWSADILVGRFVCSRRGNLLPTGMSALLPANCNCARHYRGVEVAEAELAWGCRCGWIGFARDLWRGALLGGVGGIVAQWRV